MSALREVLRFELAHHFRRMSTWFYFVLSLGLCTSLMQVVAGGPRDDGSFNSPFTLLIIPVFGGMLALVIMAAFAGDAAARDAELRADALFFTTPVGKRAYLLGRFLGAFVMNALLVLALPIGCLLAVSMAGVDPGKLLPFSPGAYLKPYLIFALPNAFVATALLFSAAAWRRRATASYAAAALLFFAALICGKLLAPRIGVSAALLLDPLGFTTINSLMMTLTALQKDTFVLRLDSVLLANRLLWLTVASGALGVLVMRFSFAHRASITANKRTQKHADAQPATIAMPATNRAFDTATRLRQLRAITSRSFRDLHGSRVWWIVPLLAVLFVAQAPALARNELGIPEPLTTTRLVAFLTSDVAVLFTLLIALSAGELVWRERGARMHALSAVTPLPESLSVVGKFLALALMLATTMVVFLVTGLAVQALYGAEQYEPLLYVKLLFGLQLPEYLLFAALAMFVHVVVNQKYVANVLLVFFPVVRDIVRSLGIEDNLLLYGSLPRWMHSDISGFSPSTEARLWFTLYFAGWALLFALAANLFWIRGEERGIAARVAQARKRLRGSTAGIAMIAVAVIAGAGGFIFYNTHIRTPYRTTAALEERRAEYERHYGRFAALAQPELVATTLRVEFYPQRRTATIEGSYRLINRSGRPIETVHVATPLDAKTRSVTFDRASHLTLDEGLDHRIYALDRPLAPNESLQMKFAVDIETNPFQSYGTPPVVSNGSVLIHRPRDGSAWLPVVGYQSVRELDEPGLRRHYALRPRSPWQRLGDTPVGNEQKGYEVIDFDATIGTEAGQIGVAPGAMKKTWQENGRSYVRYVSDAPISNAWTITSARYATRRAEWRPAKGAQQPVAIEILHHPGHTANLDSMIRGVEASLEHDTRVFGAYPYRQLRLVEFPSDAAGGGLTAHSGLITYAEGFSLLRSASDPRKIDFPFAVVAHEMGHQWWGHRLTPAVVEGAPFLAESLSWYTSMLVVEQTLGREHLLRLLDVMRADYLQPNQPRTASLLRARDQLDAYRRGPFAMFALRERVGVEPVNRALRNLLAKFPPGRAPYPTSLDFYEELRAATPPSAHPLLRDLFEEITFWDFTAKGIEVMPDGRGAFRVALRIDAQKVKGDSNGVERSVAMNDTVELLVYDAQQTPLYRGSHRLHSGKQTIELTVHGVPAGAIIDPDHELLDRRPDDNEVSVSH